MYLKISSVIITYTQAIHYSSNTNSSIMDFVKKFAGGNEQAAQQGSAQQAPTQQGESGGFLGGIGNKLNSAAGGGPESEKNEDYLDKGKLTIMPSILNLWQY